MRIERLNDNQIRCTLYKKDLMDRELRLSELAYGSDKANALFRDMIEQASEECNFDADDSPLMIEAIPVSNECLVLLITKCDLDELDTRFSRFTPSEEDDAPFRVPSAEPEDKSYADEVLSCFDHISELLGEQLSAKLLGNTDTAHKSLQTAADLPENNTPFLKTLGKIYTFDSLDAVINLAHVINPFYHGENTLYKNPDDGLYYLVVNLSEHTAGEFNKVCNIISEYGQSLHVSRANIGHYDEHFEVIVRDKAVQVLSKL
ncbi:MAG: adaptor protein MecA [Lachnospiraceae bacterium]|nr:adaptor protein MecA [Lachnospiraceae bacterium]